MECIYENHCKSVKTTFLKMRNQYSAFMFYGTMSIIIDTTAKVGAY